MLSAMYPTRTLLPGVHVPTRALFVALGVSARRLSRDCE